MKKLIPIMVTTYEALCACATEKTRLIYVTFGLWDTDWDRIGPIMEMYGYRIASLPARHGMFYIRGYRFRKYYIEDPYHLY